MQTHISSYTARLSASLLLPDIQKTADLANALLEAWKADKSIYFCGNGGSAGNAIHLANDFIYGAGRGLGKGELT
jgi:D-sedoheptulose 7-phosphate isomerase